MKTIISIISILFALVFVASATFAQQDISKEAVVYFSSGVQRVGQTSRATLQAVEISVVLQKYNVRAEDVSAAFPDFVESDTVKVMPDGRKIGHPNFAKIFKIRTPSVTARNALINDLKKLTNVLFAEPNGTAERW